ILHPARCDRGTGAIRLTGIGVWPRLQVASQLWGGGRSGLIGRASSCREERCPGGVGCAPRPLARTANSAHFRAFKHASAGPADRLPAAGWDRRMADPAPADWAEDHGPAALADRGPADRSVRAALRPRRLETLVSSESSCDVNDRRPPPFQR